MALRPDSVYRVDLGGNRDTGTRIHNDAGQPPKVIQIRLTEHTLHELVAAHAQSDSAAKICIDVDKSNPTLVIGGVAFPLQAPLTPSGSATATPSELFRLSDDESTLLRLGTVASRLSIRPTSNVSAAAQRLKHQREEEELRKEERKRAVMLGSNVQPTNSAPKRAGANANSRSNSSSVNKNLSAVKSLGPTGGSPLSRSASLNKLSARKEFRSTGSSFPSREQSPSLQDRPMHRDASMSQNISQTASRGLNVPVANAHNPTNPLPRSTNPVASNLPEEVLSDSDENGEDIRLSDESPNLLQTANDVTKKSNSIPVGKKLTTRQRLAKAAKGGSRMIPDAEHRGSSLTGQVPSAGISNSQTRSSESAAVIALPEAKALGHRRATSAISVKDFEKEASLRLSGPSRSTSPGPTLTSADHVRSTAMVKTKSIANLPPQQAVRDQIRPSQLSSRAKGAEIANVDPGLTHRNASSSPDRKRIVPDDRDIDVPQGTTNTFAPTRSEIAQTDATITRKRRRSNDFVSHDSLPERKVHAHGPRPGTQEANRADQHFPKQRSVKGVGPGATHWSEPWLDVRSRADWHKLAERFAKAREEYTVSRLHLEEENDRLDVEMQLVKALDNQQEQSRDTLSGLQSTNKHSSASTTVDKETKSADAIGKASQSHRSGPDDESPEEGEMVSSDEEKGKVVHFVNPTLRIVQNHVGALEHDDEQENLAWRQTVQAANSSRSARQPGPLSYKDLSERLARLHDLHGSLSRMHHVLVAFRKREESA